MSVAGLFAGIGGFELGFSRAGFDTGLLVEVDPAANAVLKKRFPDAEVRSDVADLGEIPAGTHILTAGFPCQNLSMAGDKTGINGEKSSIVIKLLELIAKSRVPIVVIENVFFMLKLDSGSGMRWLVEEFERLGYSWAYRVLDTMGFGLPHRRRRVYLVAAFDVDPRCILFADNETPLPAGEPSVGTPLGFYWTEGRSGVGFTVDGIPPLKVGSALGIPSAPAVLFPDGEVLMPSAGACEQLQGFPRGWMDIDGRYPDRRSRWRMIGNAVSVPVAHWVGGRIKNPGQLQDFEQIPLGNDAKWPNAAWNVGSGRIAVAAGGKPIAEVPPSVINFRDSTWSRLSDRALNGFLKRATEGNLRMPEGFLHALRDAPRRETRHART